MMELKEIRKSIVEGYINGVHIFRDPAKMKSGFHPEFCMSILESNNLLSLPLSEWILKIEGMKKTDLPSRKVEYEIPIIDYTEHAAFAKILLFVNSEHIFTDYLLLYKFEDGWKIVNKIFKRFK